MSMELSENEIKSLIESNIRDRRKNRIRRHLPLTYPYTYWVYEGDRIEEYHCAYCGKKTETPLDDCPNCHSSVIYDFNNNDMKRYLQEIEYYGI